MSKDRDIPEPIAGVDLPEDAPWLRLTDETPKAYEAFQIYRDLGITRSYGKVAAILGKNISLMTRWAGRYHWVWRAHQFDRYLDEERVRVQVAEVREMSKRHASQAQSMTSALMVPVHALLERLGRDPSVIESLGDTDLIELIMLCSKMSNTMPSIVNVERLARGEATDIVKQLAAPSHKEDSVVERIQRYRHVFERIAKQGAADGGDEGDSAGK